jgi:hypothetical protein
VRWRLAVEPDGRGLGRNVGHERRVCGGQNGSAGPV